MYQSGYKLTTRYLRPTRAAIFVSARFFFMKPRRSQVAFSNTLRIYGDKALSPFTISSRVFRHEHHLVCDVANLAETVCIRVPSRHHTCSCFGVVLAR